MIRAFLAIRPAADVLESIAALQSELGKSGGDVRWTAADSLHMTVQFLGDVREHELATIERGLVESFRAQPPIDVECRGFGVFPNQKKPRVVWVGLSGDGLASVAERTEIALSPIGFPPEEREFHPHITIGRVRSVRGFEGLLRSLKGGADRNLGTSRIDHMILYKSDLRPDRSIYTPITTIPLAG
jgi:2'-5' RNA ligase